MSDLVKRLRNLSVCEPGCNGRCIECPADVVREAADLIERLEAALRNADAVLSGCECAKHWSSAEAAVIRHAREKISAAIRALAEKETDNG